MVDALLRGYSQVLFGRSHGVGALLLLATLAAPRVGLAGVVSVLVASLVARALSLSEDLVRSGLFGYNALLVGLGLASAYQPGPRPWLMLLLAVSASVLVTAAIHSALGAAFNLPALTLPFLFVYTLLIAAGPGLGLVPASAPVDPWAAHLALPDAMALFLRSLGAIFFLPRVDTGAMVLLALLVHSRVATLLAVLGFAVSQVMGVNLTELGGPGLPMVLGYNFILTSVALGGVWFVPSKASFVLALGGALFCGLVALGMRPFLAWNGVPLLILPFNVTILMLLYAMRQRTRDRAPKSVDFLLGTPEENLGYYRTRVSRFGAHYLARFAAPFTGRWTCTQGVNGAQSHKGPWRHAFDFEVIGRDGNPFRKTGKTVRDYLCYRLPVLASSDGTVAKVVDGVPDNKPGEVNLKQNWGNLVILYHGPGVYSMVCHLVPGSIKVQEGQPVRAGDPLGQCGSSGRSPVPHVHFQIQATARVGAPTLYAELHDVVVDDREGRAELRAAHVVKKGERVRNIEAQEEIGALLDFTYGEALTFQVTGPGKGRRRERITPDIDLMGNLLLRSDARGSVLYYLHTGTHHTVLDSVANHGSVLRLLHTALSRVPFEVSGDLTWHDALPPGHVLPWWSRLPLDLVSPFWEASGVHMTYHAEREAGVLVVTGRSRETWRGEEPLVRTRAMLGDGVGVERLEVTVRGRARVAERVHDEERVSPG